MVSFLRASLVTLQVAAVLACVPVLAGTTGDLRGRILGPALQPLPGVTVTARNAGLALVERGTVSDAAGNYRIPGLPPGSGYRVRVFLPTFGPVEFSDVTITAGEVTTLDAVLRPATELQETVRVPGKTSVVDTESVVTSSTFTAQFIAGLPLLGRNYQDILTLAPGVTDVDETGNPNVHGARDTSVVTLVDGVSTTDPFTGYYGQQLNVESIEELEVITAGATAEFSRAQGGFANIITKSGGNEFRGDFKFFMRTNRLDGDGAGNDPPDVTYGFRGAESFADLRFTDLYPFLSVSGPLLRNKLWYYLSGEYLQIETPRNLLTQAIVSEETGTREFGKISWQSSPGHRWTLSAIVDRAVDRDLGLASFTDRRSGFLLKRGGPTYVARESAAFSPSLLLESTGGWSDFSFERRPNANPDTNGNGILFVDDRPDLGGNGDGIVQARERDPGEDWDRDRAYDLFEDANHDSRLTAGEDLDQDGRLTQLMACEGRSHEDMNCDGILNQEVDLDQDGIVDPEEDVGLPCPWQACGSLIRPGTEGNGRFDTEDRNGNGVLDVVNDSGLSAFPFWSDLNGDGAPEPGEYRRPQAPDEDYYTDPEGRTFGPYPVQALDHRRRLTWREDFSIYREAAGGSHDLKMGFVFEHEGYRQDIVRRPILNFPSPRSAFQSIGGSSSSSSSAVSAVMAFPAQGENNAVGDDLGLYVQDTYKPLANLSVGLGIRVDLETVRAAGFKPFDPRKERDEFDALVNLSGLDTNPMDNLEYGGLASDPLYRDTNANTFAQIRSAVLTLAPSRYTRHNSVLDIFGPYLERVLGQVPSPGDYVAFGIRAREPEEMRIRNANVAPRLSVSWDPAADGKAKAFASWSRFYDKVFLSAATGEQGPDDLTRYYAFDPDGVTQAGIPDNQLGDIKSQSPLSAFQVDRSLSTPYTDEMTIGFARELAPELSVSIRYIRRDYRQQLQDVDINHHTAIDPYTGKLSDLFGAELKPDKKFDPPVEPGTGGRNPSQRIPDGLPDLYIENPFFNRVFRLGNFNTQAYRGWEVEWVRRLSRKWQMQASYTYSRTWGDAENYLSTQGDDPSLAEFEPGYLSYDQRHVIKVSAVTHFPGNWRLGWRTQWASGLPYSSIYRGGAADDVGYGQFRLLYGRFDGLRFVRENRNIHRNRALYDFNFRVEKNLVLGRAMTTAFFEAFNLLNTDDLMVDDMQWRLVGFPLRPHAIVVLEGERRFGRRFEFGIQIDF
jgi:carboxypeptidase family protein/TonB-dependent receptor-like protein